LVSAAFHRCAYAKAHRLRVAARRLEMPPRVTPSLPARRRGIDAREIYIQVFPQKDHESNAPLQVGPGPPLERCRSDMPHCRTVKIRPVGLYLHICAPNANAFWRSRPWARGGDRKAAPVGLACAGAERPSFSTGRESMRAPPARRQSPQGADASSRSGAPRGDETASRRSG